MATMDHEGLGKRHKLGVVSGVYIPVCLNILSILMFLRFGQILGLVGLLGMLGTSPATTVSVEIMLSGYFANTYLYHR